MKMRSDTQEIWFIAAVNGISAVVLGAIALKLLGII